MSAIRKAAKGEQCTLNIAGVCNYNPETTVLCHFLGETHGMGLKSDDLSAGFGCSTCPMQYDRPDSGRFLQA
ncbi:nuclease domain-containing protein [Neisseria lactamica]|uniref:nuclease domain-containing protein n=1 Tax=Neisseria lactamica TaxID=486 RepID=UPI0002E29E14|nr:nuclease domain-containing protein [Neisseria lactamica]